MGRAADDRHISVDARGWHRVVRLGGSFLSFLSRLPSYLPKLPCEKGGLELAAALAALHLQPMRDWSCPVRLSLHIYVTIPVPTSLTYLRR